MPEASPRTLKAIDASEAVDDASTDESDETDEGRAFCISSGATWGYNAGVDASDDSDATSRESGPEPGIWGIKDALATNPVLAALLIFVPIGFYTNFAGSPNWIVFATNFMAILPMAWLIGKSTEDLASSCGDVLGGLLNATFGNVVEMLLCCAGIRQGQLIVVQCTLVGSILSNLLLVMGTAFLWGGYHYKEQKFSKAGGGVQSSLLLLAVLCIVLPTVYASLVAGMRAVVEVSRGISVMMFLMYLQYLVFQLYTHPSIFDPEAEKKDADSNEDEDEEEKPDMTPCSAALVLGVATILTSCCSEYLIASIEGTIQHWKVTPEFLGVIILPIIGNAAEHYSAILVAGRKKMDLALNIAVGSACQMALLVTPFTVLAGWMLGTEVTLNFHPFQATVLLLVVLVVANILKDGDAYWLEGSMLTAAYCTVALIYYFDREEYGTDGTAF